MAYMDHGLPQRLAGGTLSEARVMWTFVPDGGELIEFRWDIGHEVKALGSDGQLLDRWTVGNPDKATTSRRTVENSIRRYLAER